MKRSLHPRAAILQMQAYSPPTGGREGKLRLDFNENTIGCSPAVAKAMREKVGPEQLAVYPEYARARAALSAFLGVDEAQLLLTNGTDEAIQLLINTYVDAGDEVIIPHPSYAMYRFYAEVAGASVQAIPYREKGLEFPIDEVLAAVDERTRAVLLANPNNPTGTGISLGQIEQILEKASGAAVLVDEAYYEFYRVTALPLLKKFPNLFVCRTFSKAFGMAGLRLGCLMSDPENLQFVRKAQSPYSVNVLALIAAQAAVRDRDYVDKYVREVIEAREFLSTALAEIGVPFCASCANFLLLRLGSDGRRVKEDLEARGILVRDRSYELPGCVRVTIGSKAQMETFLAALRPILAKGGEWKKA